MQSRHFLSDITESTTHFYAKCIRFVKKYGWKRSGMGKCAKCNFSCLVLSRLPPCFFPCLWGKAFKSGQNMRGYNERRERKRENGFGVGLCRRRRRCANSNFDSKKALKGQPWTALFLRQGLMYVLESF